MSLTPHEHKDSFLHEEFSLPPGWLPKKLWIAEILHKTRHHDYEKNTSEGACDSKAKVNGIPEHSRLNVTTSIG